MIYIFLFSGLIILFTMYFINLSATKPNNNIVIADSKSVCIRL